MTGERAREWRWFAAWALAGGLYLLGLLSLLSIGIFVLAVAALLTLVLVRTDSRSGVACLISGGALPLAYVAWLNRGGPGTVCHSISGNGSSCTDEWSPWPFAIVAVVLLVAGITVFQRRRHTSSSSPATWSR